MQDLKLDLTHKSDAYIVPDIDEVLARIPANDDLALLRVLGSEAGKIAHSYFCRDPEVWWKEGQSPVSEGDFAVDKFLREAFLKARPDYGWLSEETEDNSKRLSAKRTIIVDPIDGTRAFIEGKKIWCVSIGIVENGIPLTGVLNCPALGEEFYATKGAGAFKNGELLKVCPRQENIKLRIGGQQKYLRELPQDIKDQLEKTPYIPSLAYRLAMVADGRFHATFVRENAHDWDIAAAVLLVQEAGGHIANGDGHVPILASANPRHGGMVVGIEPLMNELIKAITKADEV